MNKRKSGTQSSSHASRALALVVAAIFGSTPAISLAFSLGQASHHLEIGKPLSIRIPIGSLGDDFNASCMAVSKSAEDPRGDNFPTDVKVSMIAGAQPMLLLSGSAVKQPIVEFTVKANCPNTKYERTYLLLPDVVMTDTVAVEMDEPVLLPVVPAAKQEEKRTIAAPLIPRSQAALRAKPKVQSELALRLDDTIAPQKKLLPFRPATTGLSKDLMQKFEKMRTDLDTASSSLDRLSVVVTSQMDVQLKSANELSRMSTLLVEHDEKIAVLSNRMASVEKTERQHGETLSHRGTDNLVTAFGGGLLGFCFSAAGFFLFNRRRMDSQPTVQQAIEPASEFSDISSSSRIDIVLDDQAPPTEMPALPEEPDHHHLDFVKTTRLVRMA